MDLRHVAGQQECLEVHQRGDWQPRFDASRTGDACSHAATLEVAHPHHELHADEEGEAAEDDLAGESDLLGDIAAAAAEGFSRSHGNHLGPAYRWTQEWPMTSVMQVNARLPATSASSRTSTRSPGR